MNNNTCEVKCRHGREKSGVGGENLAGRENFAPKVVPAAQVGKKCSPLDRQDLTDNIIRRNGNNILLSRKLNREREVVGNSHLAAILGGCLAVPATVILALLLLSLKKKKNKEGDDWGFVQSEADQKSKGPEDQKKCFHVTQPGHLKPTESKIEQSVGEQNVQNHKKHKKVQWQEDHLVDVKQILLQENKPDARHEKSPKSETSKTPRPHFPCHIVLQKNSSLRHAAKKLSRNKQMLDEEFSKVELFDKAHIIKNTRTADLEKNRSHNRYCDIGNL